MSCALCLKKGLFSLSLSFSLCLIDVINDEKYLRLTVYGGITVEVLCKKAWADCPFFFLNGMYHSVV